MASKGQKFNKYTKELIRKVLNEYKSGIGSAFKFRKEIQYSVQNDRNFVQ